MDVDALLRRIEGNDAAACAIREETRGEATSTSLESKKKNEECKIKNPQINNVCMEKILLQLMGAVMKVENLLKCIIVVLVFFGLTILAKIWCCPMYPILLKKQRNALCCVKLRCKFRICGPRGAAPDQTPQSRPIKEHIP